MGRRLLIYRVEKRRFCLLSDGEKVCDGLCRVAVSSSAGDRRGYDMCPVYEEVFDRLVNGD